jgi:hypothetical protein
VIAVPDGFSNIHIQHSVMFDGECKNSRLMIRMTH